MDEHAHVVGLRVKADEEGEAEADETGAESRALDHHVDANDDEKGVDADVLLLAEAVAGHVQVAAVEEEVVHEVGGTPDDGGPTLRDHRVGT